MFAFDRWLTLYVVAPMQRLFSRRAERVLPILMYHSISDDPETGVRSYYRICTSPARFAEQMSWLAASGWQGVTLRDGLAWLEGQKPMTGKPVALTFDDGFRDFYTAAAPVLRGHGFRATMYLITDYVSESATPKAFKGKPCLTWDEVRTLRAEGFEFGSHTVSHPELVRVDRSELQRQLTESRVTIAEHLGAPVASFAYPYAFPSAESAFVRNLTDAVRSAGYANCVTTCIGRVTVEIDALCLPRLPVNQNDKAALLHAKVNGAYDWLGPVQRIMKSAQRRSDHRPP